MENSVAVQSIEFLHAVALGAALGMLYDIIRLVRGYIRRNRGVTAVLDILFWISAIFALLTFVLTVSGGKMRWYVLFGVFCGGFMYISALSQIIFAIMRTCVAAVRKILSLITRPLYLLLRGVWRGAGKLFRRTEAKIRSGTIKKRRNKRKAVANGGKEEKEK